MSDAVAGVGTLFGRWNGSEWENLVEVLTINGPTPSKEVIDVTSLDSTGGYREFIGSFKDGGTVQLSLNFTRAMFEMMKEDFESDELGTYRVVLPDAENSTLIFDGLVMEHPLAISADKQVTFDVSIKVSGEPVLESGTSSGV
jgi:predicted secreted protein